MQAIFCRIGSMRTIVRFQNWPWRLLSGLCQHRIRERRVGGCDLVRGPAMRTPNGKFESTKPRQRRLVSPDCRPNRAATVRALVRQHAFFLVHHGQPPRYYKWSLYKDYRSRGSTGRAQGLPPLFTGYVQEIIGQLISGSLPVVRSRRRWGFHAASTQCLPAPTCRRARKRSRPWHQAELTHDDLEKGTPPVKSGEGHLAGMRTSGKS